MDFFFNHLWQVMYDPDACMYRYANVHGNDYPSVIDYVCKEVGVFVICQKYPVQPAVQCMHEYAENNHNDHK